MNKLVAASIASVAGFELLKYIYQKYSRKKDVEELLFFQGDTCSTTKCNLKHCSYHNLRKMINYLLTTQSSLDICLYLLSCRDLIHIINRLHDRGVEIRLITDSGSNGINHNMLQCFYDRGITIKTGGTKSLMHHKFAILDKKIVMFGSLNWTRIGIYNNWDNIYITSSKEVISKFSELFNDLWNDFKNDLIIDNDIEKSNYKGHFEEKEEMKAEEDENIK